MNTATKIIYMPQDPFFGALWMWVKNGPINPKIGKPSFVLPKSSSEFENRYPKIASVPKNTVQCVMYRAYTL